jgi:hypothetical protein
MEEEALCGADGGTIRMPNDLEKTAGQVARDKIDYAVPQIWLIWDRKSESC